MQQLDAKSFEAGTVLTDISKETLGKWNTTAMPAQMTWGSISGSPESIALVFGAIKEALGSAGVPLVNGFACDTRKNVGSLLTDVTSAMKQPLQVGCCLESGDIAGNCKVPYVDILVVSMHFSQFKSKDDSAVGLNHAGLAYLRNQVTPIAIFENADIIAGIDLNVDIGDSSGEEQSKALGEQVALTEPLFRELSLMQFTPSLILVNERDLGAPLSKVRSYVVAVRTHSHLFQRNCSGTCMSVVEGMDNALRSCHRTAPCASEFILPDTEPQVQAMLTMSQSSGN